MKTKHRFWKVIIVVLLYNLITHWKDAKQGFMDGMHETWHESSVQKTK